MHDERHAAADAQLLDQLEIEVRLGPVEAVHRAHAGREGVDARVGHEARGLVGVGVHVLPVVVGVLEPFVARGEADLGLHVGAVLVGQLHRAQRQRHVLLVGKLRAVDHDGREPQVEGAAHVVDILAVVEHHAHGNARGLGARHHDGADHVDGRLLLVQLRVLDDDRLVAFLGRADGREQKLEVRRVEGGGRAVVLFRPGEDGSQRYEHGPPLLLQVRRGAGGVP